MNMLLSPIFSIISLYIFYLTGYISYFTPKKEREKAYNKMICQVIKIKII